MLHFRVERKKCSYDFRAYRDKPLGFDNNWNNNSLDSLLLYEDLTLVVGFKCQTVANYCFGVNAGPEGHPHISTVAEGDFTVKAFVEPRRFHGEIHAITRTRDRGGKWIDHNAMQLSAEGYQLGRWLIHDRYSFALGKDTNYAWSAGCFILSSNDLKALNSELRRKGAKAGDLISGVVVEV